MIRVLRVLEYHYNTLDEMSKDMADWFVPPTGNKIVEKVIITSAVMLPSTAEEEINLTVA